MAGIGNFLYFNIKDGIEKSMKPKSSSDFSLAHIVNKRLDL